MVALRRQIDSLKYGTSASSGTSLRSQLDAKRATLAEARQRYGAEHPDIKQAAARHRDARDAHQER